MRLEAPSAGPLSALLDGGDVAAIDGGLATQLEAQGFDLSDDLWSARLLRDDPAAIEEAHLAFLRAGARVVISASYQASEEGFVAAGIPAGEAAALLRRSVELARGAVARFSVEAPDAPRALVAASAGPYGAILADGQEYTGDYGDVTIAAVEAFHERRLRALLQAEPDCVACETIPRADEAAALARVLDRLEGPEAWVCFSCADGRTTCHGEPIEEAVAAATASPRVVAVGVNCTTPEHVEELLTRAGRVTDRALVAYPNNGRVWDGARRAWTRSGVAGFPRATVDAWTAAGARLVGGCCGIGPDGVAGIAAGVGAP